MKTIICFGDSNTYGYDPRSALGGRYSNGAYWVELLHRKTGWNFWNMGVCGRTIPRTSFQISTACGELQAREASADALWIMLGTNDLLEEPTLSADAIADRLGFFLHALLRTWPREKLRIITPVKLQEGTWVEGPEVIQKSEDFPRAYEKLTEKMKVALTSTEGWEIPLAFDGVHFTEEGHRKFAENLCREIPFL